MREKHKNRLRKLLKAVLPNYIYNLLLKIYYKGTEHENISRFWFRGKSIKNDLKQKYDYDGELGDIFSKNKEKEVHKWHHYIPIYDKFFSKYKNTRVRFLEIGVAKGGSLSMWRKYFGNSATIYGVDINENCLEFDGIDAQVRIGSQIDSEFIKSIVSEMGGVDIVLDDGSHQMEHIRRTFEILYPELSYNGIYFIEDLHTAYWRRFGGGIRSKKNFFNYIRELMDDIHFTYHQSKLNHPNISAEIGAIHIYDSIVVIEKERALEPTHSAVS